MCVCVCGFSHSQEMGRLGGRVASDRGGCMQEKAPDAARRCAHRQRLAVISTSGALLSLLRRGWSAFHRPTEHWLVYKRRTNALEVVCGLKQRASLLGNTQSSMTGGAQISKVMMVMDEEGLAQDVERVPEDSAGVVVGMHKVSH